jgi:hypothetical protein
MEQIITGFDTDLGVPLLTAYTVPATQKIILAVGNGLKIHVLKQTTLEVVNVLVTSHGAKKLSTLTCFRKARQ